MRKQIKKVLTDDIATLGELAKELGLSIVTLQTMRRRGYFEAVKRGKTWLVDRHDFKDRLKARH